MRELDDGSFRELRDPQERDPTLGAIIKAAAREAEAALRKEGHRLKHGYCHLAWGRQQLILREKRGIDWQSPAEMNPDIMYD